MVAWAKEAEILNLYFRYKQCLAPLDSAAPDRSRLNPLDSMIKQ